MLQSFSKSLPRNGNKEAKSSPGSQSTCTGLPTLSTDSVALQVEGGHRAVVLESFSKSLPRKGNKEAEGPPDSQNTQPGLPTLSTDFVARQVEGGHRAVVLESFSKSLPGKGNKEAESPPGSPNTNTSLPTLITDFVVAQVETGDRFGFQSFCKGLAQKRNKAATALALSVPIFFPCQTSLHQDHQGLGHQGDMEVIKVSRNVQTTNACHGAVLSARTSARTSSSWRVGWQPMACDKLTIS